MAARLFSKVWGSEASAAATPLVLLHGFGGLAIGCQALAQEFCSDRQVIAFDLPGHGQSLNYPKAGHPRVAAAAVIRELKLLGLGKVHLCGHSMGGAIGAIIALQAPELIASLTLIAPGGFGNEINSDMLRSFAGAATSEEFERQFQKFYSLGYQIPEEQIDLIVADRQRTGARGKLIEIAEIITKNGTQGLLPLDDLAVTGLPIHVIWGSDDQVVPVEQSRNLPSEFHLHLLENIGHNPHEEALNAVSHILRDVMRNS